LSLLPRHAAGGLLPAIFIALIRRQPAHKITAQLAHLAKEALINCIPNTCVHQHFPKYLSYRTIAGMNNTAINMTIRVGSIDDVEAVYRLNKDVFSEYWSRPSLYSSLESGYDLLLCEFHGEVIAYLLSLAVLDEIQIMQIAVSSSHRRLGLASRMTETLIASARHIQIITLEVRLSNHAAKACYDRLGFQEVGYRKKYYAPDVSGYREDAVLMSKGLSAAP